MKRFFILLIIIPFLLYVNPVVASEKTDLQEELIYSILVDRFNNGDQSLNKEIDPEDPLAFHGGDLQGIIDKLDRIEELGFTTISLSSIMQNSSNGYHGYWIEDFYNIEEHFGTMEILKELIEKAHEREIKVILELVTNFVSKNHPFVDDSDKEDWFKPNTIAQTPANAWLEHVALLDQDHPEVQEYLMEVAEFWMNETDIDGYIFHAADIASENFLENLTEQINHLNPDFYLLGHILQDASDVQANLSMLDAVENQALFEKMNDIFIKEDQPISELYDVWLDNEQQTSLLYVDNQNTARFSNNFADHGRNAVTTWRLALTYMYTTPGIPFIFQGSDLPMYGPSHEESQHLVQFNSTDPDIEEIHHRLSSIRSEYTALIHGDYEQVGVSGAMSVFKRSLDDEDVYVAINNSTELQSITLSGLDPDIQLNGLLGDNLVREGNNGEFVIDLPRESVEIYVVSENTGLNWLFINSVAGIIILFALFIVVVNTRAKRHAQKQS